MRKIKIGKFRLHLHTPALNMKFSVKKLSAIMPPVDDSSTRGGSTSVRGRVRRPAHMWPAVAKLQAAVCL